MKIVKAFFLAALMLCLAGNALGQDVCTAPVKTASGMVKGFAEKDGGSCSWLGVPYVAAPVGDLRWKAPAPAVAWSGVREADKWGPRYVQNGVMELVNYDPSGKMSEDCLFLNIWRPDKPGKFPVMFWVHGGGYMGGTGNTDMYRGDRMAAASEVVVVTFNYRLNIFGFMALPALKAEDLNQSTGNYGMLDQVAALKWVHDNISGFGGDPDNVTIFGESAGGGSIYILLATPLTKGLFHKAIMESGGIDGAEILEQTFKQMPRLVETLGCKMDDLACLRQVPAKKLLKAVPGMMMSRMYSPHVDGYLLTAQPVELVKSNQFNNVPFMAGSNLNEADILVALNSDLRRTKPAHYQEMIVKKLGATPEEAEKIAQLYPLSEYDNKPINAFKRIGSEASMPCAGLLGAKEVAGFQKQVYLYRFDYHNIMGGKWVGAFHSLEMPFIFNTMDQKPLSMVLKTKNQKEMDELSRIMQGYWTNFAKTGNPNGPGIPEWPAFQLDSPKVQVLDTRTRPEDVNNQKQCEFWKYYDKSTIPGL